MRCISGRFPTQTEGKRLVTQGFISTDLFCAVGFFDARFWTVRRRRATLVSMAIKVPLDPTAWRWRRRVLVPVLARAVRGITRVRRWTGPALDRLHLHLIAWRSALDPETAIWIEEAKRSVTDGTAAAEAWTADDLRRMIESRRRLTG
jgi:hypothetical protein